MTVVGVIILLHTLIPHQHFESETTAVNIHAHNCQINLLADIQLSLSLDHGQGHFEHFIELDQAVIDLFLATDELAIKYFDEAIAVEIEREERFASDFHCLVSLRGPPLG